MDFLVETIGTHIGWVRGGVVVVVVVVVVVWWWWEKLAWKL